MKTRHFDRNPERSRTGKWRNLLLYRTMFDNPKCGCPIHAVLSHEWGFARSTNRFLLSSRTPYHGSQMNLATLPTESRNPATEHIDDPPPLAMLRLINNEDAKVAHAVAAVLPDIAKAVEEITRRLNDGGRLFYIGAGTSGRLGVLDASEIPPPFSVPAALVQGL